ncbi:MAG: hypothetical protein AVDCRST_MAG70-1173, partial [uncultured Thermomicrobiales bacterium]
CTGSPRRPHTWSACSGARPTQQRCGCYVS